MTEPLEAKMGLSWRAEGRSLLRPYSEGMKRLTPAEMAASMRAGSESLAG